MYQPLKGFNIYFPWWNFPKFLRALQSVVDQVCDVCSSKDIGQPLFNGESLKIK